MIDRQAQLLQHLRWLISFFIVGLVASGVTAIPLETELDFLARLFGIAGGEPPANVVAEWLGRVRVALHDVNAHHPFLAYGTDWLAFGHVVIAIAFVGAWRDPVKNIWLFEFGLIACALVVPWAFVFGALRGIPIWWRLIDCSFGVFGFIPLWYCRRFARELARLQAGN